MLAPPSSSPDTKTWALPSLYILPSLFLEMEIWMEHSWGTYLALAPFLLLWLPASWEKWREKVKEEILECVPTFCSGQWTTSLKMLVALLLQLLLDDDDGGGGRERGRLGMCVRTVLSSPPGCRCCCCSLFSKVATRVVVGWTLLSSQVVSCLPPRENFFDFHDVLLLQDSLACTPDMLSMVTVTFSSFGGGGEGGSGAKADGSVSALG
mmetsp:Transcript_36578/g.88167  ORF Transcript_36578/g.88167 Transcript_36578/m.88167 type:complete len:209 (-) Transcript_36578:88-714(-)